nr:claudin-34 [Anolis sagrei ordinatus]
MEKWLRQRLGLVEDNSPAAAQLIGLASMRLCGLILAAIGWILCITATGADEWRVWHTTNVPGISTGKLWVGIWRVCFMVDLHDGEPMKMHCLEFLEQYGTLPKEIFIAQDLMSLASVVLALAVAFMSFALWNVLKNVRQKHVLLIFFRVGGVLTLLSGLIILLPLLWNMYSVLANDGIEFPYPFHLPYLPYEQTVGFAIYVGFFASGFLMSSSFFILSKKYQVTSNIVHPIIMVTPKPSTSTNDTEICPHCGSSVSVDKILSEEQHFNG